MTEPWIDFAIVIFYRGASPEGRVSHSPYENRLSYLRRTVANARQYSRRVGVFICDDHDEVTVRQELPGLVEIIRVPCRHSMHLGCNACIYVRDHATELGLADDDIIYYTEADHLLYLDMSFVPTITSILRSYPVYVSMHRLEEVYEEHGRERGLLCTLFDHCFVLPNTTREVGVMPPSPYHPAFYQSPNSYESYAGAHLSAFRTFRVAPIQNESYLEMASQFMFEAFPCLKTRNILGVYLIHLSGYDYHASCSRNYQHIPGLSSPIYAPEKI